jgi:aspartate carbamoyltransferase regulatory subunit
LALGRKPESRQIDILKTLYDEAEKHIDSTVKLDVPIDKKEKKEYSEEENYNLKHQQLSAISLETPFAYVANVILNLNEFTTKQ